MCAPHAIVLVLHALHTASVQVCYYRDKQSINKFKLATVTPAGVKITEPFALETKWDFKVSTKQAVLGDVRRVVSSRSSCATLP